MNLILLSGGSGKRIWPLSNDIRSKQFLKLFKNGNTYESMVQRILRQIKSIDSECNIIIATNNDQVDLLKNQLGNEVTLCIEPDRRDTFPAIVLALAYLHDILGIDENEAIVICPADSYVEDDYFEAVKRMSQVIGLNSSNMVLMGIEPGYPSENFGYILPETLDEISLVKEFKEKPDLNTAKKYIDKGGLWNAGVFGFKLGDVLKKSREIFEFKDYYDLLENYDKLPKTSFDFAVVENEKNIKVLRYSGKWKDVGSWNTLSKTIPESINGEVIVDDLSKNTTIINTLDIPIIATGCENLIVATSNDGILISSRDTSDSIKKYVSQINYSPKYIEKSWGTSLILEEKRNYRILKLSIKEGKTISNNKHDLNNKLIILLSGNGEIVINGDTFPLSVGDTKIVMSDTDYQINAISELLLIEINFASCL